MTTLVSAVFLAAVASALAEPPKKEVAVPTPGRVEGLKPVATPKTPDPVVKSVTALEPAAARPPTAVPADCRQIAADGKITQSELARWNALACARYYSVGP